MRCPSCGSDVPDPAPASCPRCGRPLPPDEGRATERLTVPTQEETRDVARTEPRRARDPESPFGPRRALYDFVYAFRRSLVAGGWTEAASAAALGVLALLCVGALFLIAAKLQFPDLGAGSNPLSVFVSICILALGSLRVPIHVGDLTVTALPLGALALTAVVVSWAVIPAIGRRDVHGLRPRVAAGAKIAAPFALLCWVVALVFRFRDGATPTHAGALGALILGGVWGVAFGALAGVRSGREGHVFRRALSYVNRRNALAYDALVTAGSMLGLAALGAAAAGLVWIIAGLARGAPVANFGGGDALAGFIYVLAFLPNLLVAILTVSLGAPLSVGAQVTIGGRRIGPLKTFSLWHWGGGTPWFAYALLLVPLIATIGAGVLACRRRRQDSVPLDVLAAAAAVFGAVLALLAWLGQARLGEGIMRAHGFGQISANAPLAGVLGFVWAGAGGYAGWKLGERLEAQKVQRRAEPPG